MRTQQHIAGVSHSPVRFKLSLLSLLSAALLHANFMIPTAQALPQGGQVTAGAAVIARGNAADTQSISQFTERAVIDWKTFDIGENETVNFVQPKPDYVLLNRVNGGGVSSILGKLNADGRVFLINPSGIVFGPKSQLNVGGLLATTANLTNQDFMAGQYRFAEAGVGGARVVNQGQITAHDGGLVALVAPGVRNAGLIQANFGKVTLASGTVFTLDLFGDRLVNLAVDDQVVDQLVDASGKPVRTLIDQSGRLQADGGDVTLITAGAAKDIVDSVINMSGVISARSFAQQPGLIVLHGAGGAVEVNGELNAATADNTLSNSDGSPTGGTIKILGDDLHLGNNARIDASGRSGGGLILLGADRADGVRFNQAGHTTIDKGARLFAGGGENGNGGEVRVWADQTTDFFGAITARGGDKRGDGGLVEVAAGKTLRFDGTVDVSAPNGKPGTLLRSPEPVKPPAEPVPAPTMTPPANNQSGTDNNGTVTTRDIPAPDNSDTPVLPQGNTDVVIANGNPAPAETVRADDKSVTRINTSIGHAVDTLVLQPRAAALTPVELIRVEYSAEAELEADPYLVPDFRLRPRRDGLLELHIPNPFLLGLYPELQFGGDLRVLGGMGPLGGGSTIMYSLSAGGMGGGGGGIASAPGRLPQDALAAGEGVAGEIPENGSVDIAASAPAASGGTPLLIAGLQGDNKAPVGGARVNGNSNSRGDQSKNKLATRGVDDTCALGQPGPRNLAEQTLPEFQPRAANGDTPRQLRAAAVSACGQTGGGARERARGNQSFAAYGLVNGGRGVAQAADLGRNSPVTGAVPDVFRVSYHVITAPRYVRGLGLGNNYFCSSPFGENLCARSVALRQDGKADAPMTVQR